MTAMTELELLQAAGYGSLDHVGPQRQIAAIAEFMRSHGYFKAAEMCDGIVAGFDYFDEDGV